MHSYIQFSDLIHSGLLRSVRALPGCAGVCQDLLRSARATCDLWGLAMDCPEIPEIHEIPEITKNHRNLRNPNHFTTQHSRRKFSQRGQIGNGSSVKNWIFFFERIISLAKMNNCGFSQEGSWTSPKEDPSEIAAIPLCRNYTEEKTSTI